MTTFLQLQNEVLQTLQGYGLDQPRVAFLQSSITAGDLTLSLDSVANVGQGIAEIEGELVYIQSIDTAENTATISPDGRGYYGTTAASHAANVRLTHAPVWPRNAVKRAINDVIVGTYPTLFGVAQTQFTYNPSVTTYEMPAAAERVLAVTADVNGPSREQQVLHHYAFNSVAPTDDWATTNTISLHQAVTPGRTVTVTYRKAPTALAADGDELTTSGLRETAKLLVVYGACSQLVSFIDAARLPVDTAQADEYDDKNPVGMASRVAGQLRLMYQQELAAERERLLTTTNVPITLRKR